MANMIVTILSQYENLERLAHFLSTLDLFHLALANSELFTFIRKTESIFKRLKSVALCDGHGLQLRQEFGGFYELDAEHYRWRMNGRRARYDEEIEIRVWNLKCDESNALPCLKCKVNVCEECRYVPRVRDTPEWRSCPKQHNLPTGSPNIITVFCAACDVKVEHGLPISLSKYCDCDQYTRWICVPCKVEEDRLNREYLETRTKYYSQAHSDPEEGMSIDLDMGSLSFYCPCGDRAPKGGNIRCSWCKRRHNLNTWKNDNNTHIPFFDNDPCYPVYAFVELEFEENGGNPIPYPRLAYNGPILR